MKTKSNQIVLTTALATLAFVGTVRTDDSAELAKKLQNPMPRSSA